MGTQKRHGRALLEPRCLRSDCRGPSTAMGVGHRAEKRAGTWRPYKGRGYPGVSIVGGWQVMSVPGKLMMAFLPTLNVKASPSSKSKGRL